MDTDRGAKKTLATTHQKGLVEGIDHRTREAKRRSAVGEAIDQQAERIDAVIRDRLDAGADGEIVLERPRLGGQSTQAMGHLDEQTIGGSGAERLEHELEAIDFDAGKAAQTGTR